MTSNFLSFFNDRFRRAQNDATRTRERAARAAALLKPRRLATEALEDRRLLSASAEYVDALNSYLGFGGDYTTENVAVIELDGANLTVESLQAAIDQAAASATDDAIFVVGGATLTFDPENGASFVVDYDADNFGSIAIVGYGGALEIDANGADRAFTVKNGDLLLGDVEISNGSADFGGAIAIGADAYVAVDSVVFSGNVATESGGAVANSGDFFVQNAQFIGNEAAKDGAAIYDGAFQIDPPVVVDAPEFVGQIENVVAANGETVELDLSQYFNEGDWTYSFEISGETGAFAEAPSLNGSVLTLKFIGNDEYDLALDLSAVQLTVSAASKTDPNAVATSNEFSAELANSKTVLMQAVLSNVEEADKKYAIRDGRKTAGYGADEIPADQAVDFSEYLYLELWAQDFANNWGSATDRLGSLEPTVRVVNGKLYDDVYANVGPTTIIVKEGEGVADLDGDGVEEAYTDYRVSLLYFNSGVYDSGAKRIGVDCAILLASIAFDQVDPSLPSSVYVLPSALPQVRAASRLVLGEPEAFPVHDSQIEFVGCSGGGTAAAAPVAAAPTAQASTASYTTTVVSNSVFAQNVAGGNGVVATGAGRFFDVVQSTFADNQAEGAVLFALEGTETGGPSFLANSIVVGNADAAGAALVASQNAFAFNNLADKFAAEQAGNVLYDAAKPLFVDGGYALAADSQAIGIGNADYARDVWAETLSTDISGAPRYLSAPDVGAYEFQGEAPAAPTDAKLSAFQQIEDGRWTVRLTWTDVATNETGYVVAARLATGSEWQERELAADKTALKLGVKADAAYVVRVWAANKYGTSDFVEVTFRGATDVLNGVSISTDAPKIGETLAATVDPATATDAAFQWFRVDAQGAETAIDGANAATYTATAADEGFYLKVVATGPNAAYVSTVSATTANVVVQDVAPPAVPTAPTNLVFGEYDPKTQKLAMSWTDNSTNETKFVVEYKIGNGAWRVAQTLSANATGRVATQVRAGANYEFRVSAVNAEGASEYATAAFNSARDILTSVGFSTDCPAVGEEISAVLPNADQSATYRWFRVAADGAETALGEGATYVPTADDLGAFLKVVATNANGAYFSSVEATGANAVAETSIFAPTAPTDVLFADYDPATRKMTMSWTDNSINETGFEIEYRKDGGVNANEWLRATTVASNSTGRVCSQVYDYYAYDFRVRAVKTYVDADGNEQKLYSDWAQGGFSFARDVVGSVELSTNAPAVGEAISAAVANGVEATFQWYRVADGVQTAIDGATDSTYVPTDSDVGCAIRVVASSANAAYASSATAETLEFVGETATSRPVPPTDLAFSEYDPATQTLKMSWTNASESATQVVVEYKFGDSEWRPAAKFTVDASGELASERVATKISATANYQFRVKAINANGESVYTTASFNASRDVLTSVRFDSAPSVGETASAILGAATNEATFQWFRVDADGVETAIDGATAAVYAPTAADVGCRLKVVATGANGAIFSQVSAVSEVVASAPSIPNAPTDVVFGEYDASTNRVQMSWTDNSNDEKGFVVEYSLNGGQSWLPSATLGADATGRECWGLKSGATYTFRVAAFNNGGRSDWAVAEFQVPAPSASLPAVAKASVATTIDESDDATLAVLAESALASTVDDENDPFADYFDEM